MPLDVSGRRLDDSLAEAAALLGREGCDSRRASFLEGESVTVLIAPRRGGRAGTADVWITLVPKDGRTHGLDGAAITLVGGSARRQGLLTARGRCVIRDVPDDLYRVHLADAGGAMDRAAGRPGHRPAPAER